jgi:hypothetical protein
VTCTRKSASSGAFCKRPPRGHRWFLRSEELSPGCPSLPAREVQSYVRGAQALALFIKALSKSLSRSCSPASFAASVRERRTPVRLFLTIVALVPHLASDTLRSIYGQRVCAVFLPCDSVSSACFALRAACCCSADYLKTGNKYRQPRLLAGEYRFTGGE